MTEPPVLVWGNLPQRGQPRRAGAAHLDQCAIVGCDRIREGMLCPLHTQRWRRAAPLIADADQVGLRESGFGVFGIILADEDGVLCYECGRWMRLLTAGHLATHNLTQDDYRTKHGLPRRAGLCATSYSAARRTIIEAQPGLIDAAAERLRALQPEAARLAREAIANGRVTAAGKAARADALREVARASATGKTCPVCGDPMPSGAKHRKLRVCSDECESTAKRAGAHRRAARDAGEPLSFQRREGTGRQLSFDDIAALLHRSPEAIRARLRVGTLPPHDGRRDGARWWWESSITPQPHPPGTHETSFGGTGA